MNKILRFSIFSLLLIVLVACNDSSNPDSNENQDGDSKENIRIGYAINTLNNPFFVTVKESAEKAASDAGIAISVVNANNDLATQLGNIEDLIEQKVDVIIIDPVDSKGTISAVEAANKAGIPVITTGRNIEGGEILTHLGYDEVKNGEIAGEFLANQLNGNGKVIELQGTLGTDTARMRSEGFQNSISKFSEIDIVASQSADFDRAKALSVVENLLQSNKDIVGIYAANDEMGLGALQAVKAAGLKNVKIVSNDGNLDALEAVKSGDLAGTMSVSAESYGQKAIEIASLVVKGDVQETYIELPANFVSSENVDEYLK